VLIQPKQLKDLVLKSNTVTEEKMADAEVYARNADTSIYEALIEKNFISDEQLGAMVAEYLKMPFVVLSKRTIPKEVLQIVPERVARKQKAIPFAKDANGVWIAMAEKGLADVI
jgi:type IV pilus assembly protein PilB